MNAAYVRTVQLLLDIAPVVFETPVFAMNGGTAINLFIQDMPRLSVDIDLVFLPHDLAREQALEAIAHELAAAQGRIEALGHQVEWRPMRDGSEAKLFVRADDVQVKLEANAVFRGSVLRPEWRSLAPAAQRQFSANVQVPVLAEPELYASKLVAALDRQHPRDLFDVRHMLERRAWDEALLDCFVVYLAGHNRPVHEVLFPNRKPLEAVFAQEFEGMTAMAVTVGELLATRERMLQELPRALLPRQIDFLLSLVRGEPDWALLPQAHVQHLPAIRWKLNNLSRLRKNAAKFRAQSDALQDRLHAAREA